MPSPPRRSPLFSAIVLAGVSLTSGTGCGGSDAAAVADDTGTTTDTKSGDGTADTGSASDTASPTDATDATSDAASDVLDANDACPPDSELPTPPCSFIR